MCGSPPRLCVSPPPQAVWVPPHHTLEQNRKPEHRAWLAPAVTGGGVPLTLGCRGAPGPPLTILGAPGVWGERKKEGLEPPPPQIWLPPAARTLPPRPMSLLWLSHQCHEQGGLSAAAPAGLGGTHRGGGAQPQTHRRSRAAGNPPPHRRRPKSPEVAAATESPGGTGQVWGRRGGVWGGYTQHPPGLQHPRTPPPPPARPPAAVTFTGGPPRGTGGAPGRATPARDGRGEGAAHPHPRAAGPVEEEDGRGGAEVACLPPKKKGKRSAGLCTCSAGGSRRGCPLHREPPLAGRGGCTHARSGGGGLLRRGHRRMLRFPGRGALQRGSHARQRRRRRRGGEARGCTPAPGSRMLQRGGEGGVRRKGCGWDRAAAGAGSRRGRTHLRGRRRRPRPVPRPLRAARSAPGPRRGGGRGGKAGATPTPRRAASLLVTAPGSGYRSQRPPLLIGRVVAAPRAGRGVICIFKAAAAHTHTQTHMRPPPMRARGGGGDAGRLRSRPHRYPRPRGSHHPRGCGAATPAVLPVQPLPTPHPTAATAPPAPGRPPVPPAPPVPPGASYPAELMPRLRLTRRRPRRSCGAGSRARRVTNSIPPPHPRNQHRPRTGPRRHGHRWRSWDGRGWCVKRRLRLPSLLSHRRLPVPGVVRLCQAPPQLPVLGTAGSAGVRPLPVLPSLSPAPAPPPHPTPWHPLGALAAATGAAMPGKPPVPPVPPPHGHGPPGLAQPEATRDRSPPPEPRPAVPEPGPHGTVTAAAPGTAPVPPASALGRSQPTLRSGERTPPVAPEEHPPRRCPGPPARAAGLGWGGWGDGEILGKGPGGGWGGFGAGRDLSGVGFFSLVVPGSGCPLRVGAQPRCGDTGPWDSPPSPSTKEAPTPPQDPPSKPSVGGRARQPPPPQAGGGGVGDAVAMATPHPSSTPFILRTGAPAPRSPPTSTAAPSSPSPTRPPHPR